MLRTFQMPLICHTSNKLSHFSLSVSLVILFETTYVVDCCSHCGILKLFYVLLLHYFVSILVLQSS